ncbi:hypothetical protein LTR53_000294 [Teratosphaeriaceae sp. CCFEE 6253]|nr:hypothetical protein LTR53_000294 [Teratosphaeriaceae sp. CCFEE 6253]
MLPAWIVEDQDPEVREAVRSLQELWVTKDLRIPILTGLSNPWPAKQQHREHNDKRPTTLQAAQLGLLGSETSCIPHPIFRAHLALATSDKLIRLVLRLQLFRSRRPLDILRIVATALTMSRQTRASLAALHEPLLRALYRCRDLVDDNEVLRTISTICGRFRVYDLRVHPQLLSLGLKFAARTRSLRGMKRYLRDIRESGKGMTSNVFRATIAKFSIGHRGLGEISNGRWLRSDLIQVLMGFDDCAHLPPEKQYHLGTFLLRDDWQYLHGWIAALARCKHNAEIWSEWLRWKDSEARRKPKHLASISPSVNTKTRGDYWFVEQMTYSGGLEEAWQIVEQTDTLVSTLKARIKLRLLEGLEHCPPPVWQSQCDAIQQALLQKYDAELGKIEHALGIAWMPIDLDDDAEGYHVMYREQEEVLEALGEEDFKLEEDYGYPHESVVPPMERGLHDAKEVDMGKG